MSGLKNTVKRVANTALLKGYKTNKEIKQEKNLKKQSELDKVYQNADMPDEEAIARNERRKAAMRRGSRVATILTKDTLG